MHYNITHKKTSEAPILYRCLFSCSLVCVRIRAHERNIFLLFINIDNMQYIYNNKPGQTRITRITRINEKNNKKRNTKNKKKETKKTRGNTSMRNINAH